ncbi:phage protein Gp37 [Mergibacter septicus]|uniref:phage protein Gp37 n=1 Tax=Mergibacter septicus TaxID=221402 RepID=UPI00223FB4AE|nr:phage protein Gp37 [Mergibacter septicus]
MINKIETALIDRLKRGLGKIAHVDSYAGELDDARLAIRRLPAVLISYGGSTLEKKSVSARSYHYIATDKFVVLVLVSSLRSNHIPRRGGAGVIGANQIVSAVLRLLTNQTLNQLIQPLKPLRVETLLNNAEVGSEKLTAYSIEFSAIYDFPRPLEDGRFPEQTDDPQNHDYIFNQNNGELSNPYPEFKGVDGVIITENGAKMNVSQDTKIVGEK